MTMKTKDEWMSLLEDAITIAVEAHIGQKDKAGWPYMLHPLRMMCRMDSVPEKIVAVLHDVVEDTSWTLDQLRLRGFPEEIVSAIDCVTKREGEAYPDFVERTATNPLARAVKLADLEDNMDIRRMEEVKAKDQERLTKYLTAYRRLKSNVTAEPQSSTATSC
jgi:(p)ppGpp synthase/HD superfamily hydrolase